MRHHAINAIATRTALDAAINVFARSPRRPKTIAVRRELLAEVRALLGNREGQVFYRGQHLVARDAGTSPYFTFAAATSAKD